MSKLMMNAFIGGFIMYSAFKIYEETGIFTAVSIWLLLNVAVVFLEVDLHKNKRDKKR